MPNYNPLILTGSDYKFFLALSNGVIYPLLTVDSVSMDIKTEEELIYAVGEKDPIGNKQNANSYTGKITMQAGELNAILLSEGLNKVIDITGATLGATAIQGGYNRTFKGVNINSQSESVKRKDKETLSDMNFTALGLVG